jgi:hypothetical protein
MNDAAAIAVPDLTDDELRLKLDNPRPRAGLTNSTTLAAAACHGELGTVLPRSEVCPRQPAETRSATRALYDYRVRLQRPASQIALSRLIDLDLTHAETIVLALRFYASTGTHNHERIRAETAIRDFEAAAGDETELRKIARKLRAALASRKRMVADPRSANPHST